MLTILVRKHKVEKVRKVEKILTLPAIYISIEYKTNDKRLVRLYVPTSLNKSGSRGRAQNKT